MTDYWFFLSYARRDAVGNSYVNRFHKMLAERIGQLAALPTGISDDEIGYVDTKIEPGENWPDELAAALRMSKAFVCLYSPAYFNSDYCGKELQAFRSRLNAVTSSSASRATPPLIFPVLWDRADRLPKVLPQALRDIQYTYGLADELYNSEGLCQLMSLSRHHDKRLEFFNRMAETIVQRIREHPLPPAEVLPPLHDIASAFGVPTESDWRSDLVGHRASIGPRTVRFVFVAANEAEIREWRDSVEAYGSEGGRDWRPYHSKAVGVLSQTLSAQEDLFYEYLPVDDKLLDRLREAEENKNIVVIVVDPWTIQLRSYRKSMLEYDKSAFVNTEILILWDAEDHETTQALEKLRSDIKQTFCRHFIMNTANIRDSIGSLNELEREVTEAISRARSRIIQLSDLARPVDTSVALPRYSRPRR